MHPTVPRAVLRLAHNCFFLFCLGNDLFRVHGLHNVALLFTLVKIGIRIEAGNIGEPPWGPMASAAGGHLEDLAALTFPLCVLPRICPIASQKDLQIRAQRGVGEGTARDSAGAGAFCLVFCKVEGARSKDR